MTSRKYVRKKRQRINPADFTYRETEEGEVRITEEKYLGENQARTVEEA